MLELTELPNIVRGKAESHRSSSQRGQQSPSNLVGFKQFVGGQSLSQQSISPDYSKV